MYALKRRLWVRKCQTESVYTINVQVVLLRCFVSFSYKYVSLNLCSDTPTMQSSTDWILQLTCTSYQNFHSIRNFRINNLLYDITVRCKQFHSQNCFLFMCVCVVCNCVCLLCVCVCMYAFSKIALVFWQIILTWQLLTAMKMMFIMKIFHY